MNNPAEHNDFEKRLKQAADDFLPKPSDQVWENIQDELHPRRRTYLLTVAAAILLLLATGVYFLQRQYFPSSKKPSVAEQIPSPAQVPFTHPHNNQSHEKPGNQANQLSVIPGKIAAKQQNHAEAIPGSLTRKPESRNEKTLVKNQSAEKSKLPLLENLRPAFFVPHSEDYAALYPLEYADNTQIISPPIYQKEQAPTLHKDKKASSETLHRKPSFEIFYTPSIGYRTLTKGSSGMMTSSSSSYLDQVNSSSSISKLKQQPEWSWTARAQVAFPFGKTWSLQTGLSFAEMDYRVSAYGTYPVYVQNNNSYYAASPSRPISNLSANAFAVSAAARSSLEYLHNSYIMGEIPLLINKQLGNTHSVTFNIAAGAGLSYLIHSSPVIYSPVSDRYFTGNHYIRSFNGDFLVEPSVLIPLSPHLKLDIGPSFQYQILSSYKNYPAVKEHPYLIGLKTGLQLGR